MNIIEPKVIQRIYKDVLRGEQVEKTEKYLRDNAFLYKDSSNAPLDQLAYTVYTHKAGDANKLGDLYWGTSILEPLTVNGECNMTKGHFHVNQDCAEYYFGISGEGLLLLMDENGQTWAEKVFPGSLHYINGALAHRLINIGDVRLEVGACWPTAAGHDYEAVQKQPFAFRIYKTEDGIKAVRARP